MGLSIDKYNIEFFTWSSFWMLGFLQLASLISNLCLCHDLIRTLQSPFDVASARLKWYIGYSILIPMVIMIMVIYLGRKTKEKDDIVLYQPSPLFISIWGKSQA